MNLSLPEPDCRWISAGKEFNSYTDMCCTLRVEPGRGSSLAAQKKLFARYFSYRKTEGRKIMITEVYDKPLPEGYALYDLNGGGKGKYVRYIEPLLRQMVSKHITEGAAVDVANIETFDNSGATGITDIADADNIVDVGNRESGGSDYSNNESNNNIDSSGVCSANIISDATNGVTKDVNEDPRGNAICTGFTGKSCYFTKPDLLQRLGFMNAEFFNKEATLRNRKDVILSRRSKAHPDALIVRASDINRIGKAYKNGKIKNRLIITIDDIRYFENISRLIYEKWRSAERAINKHGVIFCEPVFTLPCDDGIVEADILQNTFIKQAEDNALAEMGIKSVKQIFIEYDYKLFYLKRNNELSKIMNAPDITVSESVKITLNDSIADRVTDNSDNIDNNTEDELRLMINQMIIEDFRKRIRSCKKQYDEKHINNGDNSDDDGIWDNADSSNGDIGDTVKAVSSAASGGGSDLDSADNVRNASLDSPDNVENGTVFDTNNAGNVTANGTDNVKDLDENDNGNSEDCVSYADTENDSKNSEKSENDESNNNGSGDFKKSSSQDRVLSQPDFCKKMDKLVDIFIKL